MYNVLIFAGDLYMEDMARVSPYGDIHLTFGGGLHTMQRYDNDRLKRMLNAYNLVILAPFGRGLSEWMPKYLEVTSGGRQFKSAYWSFDSHCWHAEERKYADKFDKVYVAHRDFVSLVSEKAKWLPCCYIWHAIGLLPPLYEYPKLYDVTGLMRSYPGSERDKLKAHIVNECNWSRITYLMGECDPPSYFSTMRMGRLSLNCAVRNDLSIRFFEAMAMNSPLIQQDVSDLNDKRWEAYHGAYTTFPILSTHRDTAIGVAEQILKRRHDTVVRNTRDVVERQDMLIHRFVEIINDTLGANFYVKM